MQKVAIIGLGLIGTSIGMSLRRWSSQNTSSGDAALYVTGFDLDLDHQGMAKKMGAVDETSWELRGAVKDADLIILATPVKAMKETFENIAPLVKSGAVITDTGSTKSDVMKWAKETLPQTVSFVGGHPLAGSSESTSGASPELLKGCVWAVTPSVNAKEEAVRTVLGMVTALGAEPFFVDPTEHDAYVAGVSHLPFVVSAAIVNSLTTDPAWKDMKSLAASGFRDTTRLAAGSPEMHRDIVMTNKESVDRWISAMIYQLEDFRSRLQESDADSAVAIHEFFDKARDGRIEWLIQSDRDAEQLDSESTDMKGEGFSNQMSRMFLGGLFRKRRVQDTEQSTQSRVDS
jgi:prephenate dehydrogenase